MSTVNNGYDWKVTIIAQYTISWQKDFEDFVNTLKTQVTTPRIKIILFAYAVGADPTKPGIATVTAFDQKTPAGTALSGPKECDLYKPETLQNFLSGPVKEVEAKQHALITWGHGCGLGYFTRPNSGFDITQQDWFSEMLEKVHDGPQAFVVEDLSGFVQQIASIKANLSLPAAYPEPNKAFLKFGADTYTIKDAQKLDKALQVISAKMMATILGKLEKPIDLFIAGNCYCQMFETGFELRKCIKIMVAAQTSYPITGFGYDEFFKAMQIDSGSSPQSLAINVCTNFRNKYKDPAFLSHIHTIDPAFNFDANTVAMSANVLSYYSCLSLIIDDAGQWLGDIKKMIPNKPYTFNAMLKDTSDAVVDLSDQLPGFVDLLHFIDVLTYKMQPDAPAELIRLQQQLHGMKSVCNLAMLPPADAPLNVDLSQRTASPSFLSIFFPHHGSTDAQAAIFDLFYSQRATALSTSERNAPWEKLVRAYYDLNVASLSVASIAP